MNELINITKVHCLPLRRVYTTEPSHEPSPECDKLIQVVNKKKVRWARTEPITEWFRVIWSVFLPNTKEFGAMSGLQFLLIRQFSESNKIYTCQTTIIARQTTSCVKICPNVGNTYKLAIIWVVAWFAGRLTRLSASLHISLKMINIWLKYLPLKLQRGGQYQIWNLTPVRVLHTKKKHISIILLQIWILAH